MPKYEPTPDDMMRAEQSMHTPEASASRDREATVANLESLGFSQADINDVSGSLKFDNPGNFQFSVRGHDIRISSELWRRKPYATTDFQELVPNPIDEKPSEMLVDGIPVDSSDEIKEVWGKYIPLIEACLRLKFVGNKDSSVQKDLSRKAAIEDLLK